LPGYSWFVPKAGGHLNVGIGGMSTKLKRRGEKIRGHWDRLTSSLAEQHFSADRDWNPDGYTYYLRNDAEQLRQGNAFVVGDAVGLATRDMCEGIGPAVRSGLLAADAIATGADYDLSTVAVRSIPNPVGRVFDWAFTRRV
jgi:flavin-dependent dehydrogenase